VSQQLNTLTAHVTALSTDVRQIMTLLCNSRQTNVTSSAHTSDVTTQCKSSADGQSSPVITGILKTSSLSAAAAAVVRTPHRVEFQSQPRDQRSSSSASLTTVVRLADDHLSVSPSRRRRRSVDVAAASTRRQAAVAGQPSPLTLDQQRTAATTASSQRVAAGCPSLLIPSTDL